MKVAPVFVLASVVARAAAFQVAPPRTSAVRSLPTPSSLFSTTEDCGCGPEILSGDVPENARTLKTREALRSANVFRVSGESVSMDELIGDSQLSVVVFMRSLG
jgi:hypothetical protein